MAPSTNNEALIEGLLTQPLFAGLGKMQQTALRKFAQIQEYPPGTDFIRQGEYTRDFYVVLSGLVTAYRTERDGQTRMIEQLGPGKWFGELSAISNQPSMARLKADTACVLAVLDGGLFKELHLKSKDFREQVDKLYRKRSLAQHLRVAPLLKDLDSDLLRTLRPFARFETHPKDKVLATEGQAAGEIVLVRSGGISLTREDGSGSPKVQGYLMANSSFGEHALWSDKPSWRGTYTTLMPTDTLVLPISALHEAFGSQPAVLDQLRRAARLIAAEEAGLDTGYYDGGEGPSVEELEEQLEIMVHSESIKGGDALAIDLQKCVRCNACVESCVAVHDDRVPRLSKKGNRISAQGNAMGKELALTTSCYHCETPGCMMSCNYGAIRRDTEGLIRFVWDNCVGCAECVKGCPYDVIRLTEPPQVDGQDASPSWLEKLPLVGGFFATPKPPELTPAERGFYKEEEIKGKAVKCDRCEGLPFEACVYNCPCGAIERVPPSLIFDKSLSEIAADLPHAN